MSDAISITGWERGQEPHNSHIWYRYISMADGRIIQEETRHPDAPFYVVEAARLLGLPVHTMTLVQEQPHE
jgi:hypothetical protein